METLPFVLLISGFLLLRQVAVGRARQTPEDIKDFAVAVFTGDTESISRIAAGRGSNLSSGSDVIQPGDVGTALGGIAGNVAAVTSNRLITEMQRLAAIAGYKYRTGATGTDAYDCSGLVWRAMKNLSIYTGPRFTSNTWPVVARTGLAVRVDAPQVGDIADWATQVPGHIGVVIGDGLLYSALNPSDGIKASKIGDVHPGEVPTYWRLTK